MNWIPTTLRRAAGTLAAIATAVLATLAAAPAALAAPAGHHTPRTLVQFPPVLPAGWYKHPSAPLPAHLHTAAGGLTGGQITLIAVGAALLTAAAAALLSRAWRAHRRATAAAHA